jgi:hypothetical protein
MGSDGAQELRLLDVARRMNVDPLTVILWIESHALEAIDTRTVADVPRWRVSEGALARMLIERHGIPVGREILMKRAELARLDELRDVLANELAELEARQAR